VGKNLVQERDVLCRRLDEELMAKVSVFAFGFGLGWFLAVRNFFGEILMSVEISPCLGVKSRCEIEGVLDVERDSMCLWVEVAPACANRALFFVVLVVPVAVRSCKASTILASGWRSLSCIRTSLTTSRAGTCRRNSCTSWASMKDRRQGERPRVVGTREPAEAISAALRDQHQAERRN
jgi:hypothetical protein